ncbi:MAG: thioesterase family protein [Acidobacteriota bacterium]
MRTVRTDLRVRYSETDQMGIVYHAHYLVWFEIGRTEWCRAAGLPYAGMEKSGLFIPVTRVDCAFRRRSSYDDPIQVFTRMAELASRGCTFAYEIRNPEGELLADGATRHVFTDSQGRPRRGSEEVLRGLERFRAGSD